MEKIIRKTADAIQLVFGYGIMVCLFAGGAAFVGYVIALIAGGNVAVVICDFIYHKAFPWLVYIASVLVLLGLAKMYLCGETALVSKHGK